jgi:membrane protein required for colicin V production
MPSSVDLAALAVVIVSGAVAFFRGFVREVLSIAAWAGAGAAAWWGYSRDMRWLHVSGFLSLPADADVWATSIALFIVTLIVLWVIAGSIGHAVKASALGSVDRSLGFLFGVVRGVIILIGAYLIAWGLLQNSGWWPPNILESRSGRTICKGADWVVGQVHQTWVAAPDCGGPRQGPEDRVLKATPIGRASDAPHSK